MQKKVRVAVIITRLEQLGPILSIKDLVNSLHNIDNLLIKVYYLDKKVDPQIKLSVQAEHLNPFNFPFEDFDVIHTSGLRPDLLAFLNRSKIRYHISTINSFVYDDLAYAYNKFISLIFGSLWLRLWRRADKLVCVSASLKCYYEKWFTQSKMEVIYNGISATDNFISPDDTIIKAIKRFHSRGLKVLGSACILTKGKGIDQILNLLAVDENYSFILFGKGKEMKNLERLSKKLSISDRCWFSGFNYNAVSYFSHFDFFIIPSRSEGFGRTLIEAVQQKVPVICSDLMVFKELFDDKEVTFFKLNDVSSLLEAISISCISGKLKAEVAYKRYLELYRVNQMASKYHNLYQLS